MTGIGLAVHGVCATGFIGMRLTWQRSPRRSSGHRLGVGISVVDPRDQGDLVADPPARHPGVLAGRRHHLLHRPAPVERDQDVPERIACRVQADGERELGAKRGQAADAGHHAGRGDGDVPGAQAEAVRIVQGIHRSQDVIEVEQRLPHPHEHDVGQPLPACGQAPGGRADLVHDLRRLEVAPEAQLTGGTERAAHRAACLAGDAHRVPLPMALARRVMHQDRLDPGAISQAMERLLGPAAVADDDLGLLDRVEPERRIKGSPQRTGQHADLRGGARAGPQRGGHLASPIGWLPALGHPGLQRLDGQAGQTRSNRFGGGPSQGRRVRRDHGRPLSHAITTHLAADPISRGRPRRSSAAVILRPPGGCASNTTSRPSAATSANPSSCARSSPGRSPCRAGAMVVACTTTRP